MITSTDSFLVILILFILFLAAIWFIYIDWLNDRDVMEAMDHYYNPPTDKENDSPIN
jgi:hypothetical protein